MVPRGGDHVVLPPAGGGTTSDSETPGNRRLRADKAGNASGDTPPETPGGACGDRGCSLAALDEDLLDAAFAALDEDW